MTKFQQKIWTKNGQKSLDSHDQSGAQAVRLLRSRRRTVLLVLFIRSWEGAEMKNVTPMCLYIFFPKTLRTISPCDSRYGVE